MRRLFTSFNFLLALSLVSLGYTAVSAKTIEKIEILGNRYVLDKEILDEIQSREGSRFDEALIVEDLKRIYNMGYFQKPGLEARPEENADGNIELSFVVQENPAVRQIEVFGNEVVSEVNAFDIFKDLQGKPENLPLLSQKIQELEGQYLQNGYIVARITDLKTNDDGVLQIYVDEGQLEEIVFKGNEKTKAGFLHHLIKNTSVDQAYNEKEFSRDFKRIKNTGYFSNVSRMVYPSETGNGYTLEITVQEKRNTSIGLGGGINSNAGLFGNLNLKVGNIRGQGETLSINGMLGSGIGANSAFNNTRLFRRGNLTQVGANYSIPYFRNSQYALRLYSSFLNGPNYLVDLTEQMNARAGFAFSRRLDSNNQISLATSYNFMNLDERDDLDEDEPSYIDIISKNIRQETGVSKKASRRRARQIREKQLDDGQFISTRLSHSFVELDSNSKPRDGWRNNLAIEPAVSFGDMSSFTKLSTNTTRYFALPGDSTFLVNARTGYQVLGNTPQFNQFRLGGANGVRGYRQFSELGLGTEMAIGTTEIRSPIYNAIPYLKRNKYLKQVDFAVFADAGIVGGNEKINRFSERLNRALSVGFGLRVNLPLVGGLRVDLGFPLLEAISEDPTFMRLNFGAADRF